MGHHIEAFRRGSGCGLRFIHQRPNVKKEFHQLPVEDVIIGRAKTRRQNKRGESAVSTQEHYQIVIVGAGAGGISVAASLLKRKPDLQIALIDKAEKHYYQPGWTMVGGGVFSAESTERSMQFLIPRSATWIKNAVTGFDPENNKVNLEDGRQLSYDRLIVAPGLTLNWGGVEGLTEALGKNGVTSNYRFDLAPYTWQLVQKLKSGRALFTQPPMPIKCAGAPQKALYLSCDHWRRQGVLDNIEVSFDNAGGVLFGVADFVPSLMKYVESYGAKLRFNSNLVAVDGPARKAWFKVVDGEGNASTEEREFDMLHVVPPQRAPDFIRNSPLAGP